MKKSKRQVGKLKRGKDIDMSKRFEARIKKSQKRRAGEKSGRKAARRGRR